MKIIKKSEISRDKMLAFSTHLELLQNVDHPNIMHYYGAYSDD